MHIKPWRAPRDTPRLAQNHKEREHQYVPSTYATEVWGFCSVDEKNLELFGAMDQQNIDFLLLPSFRFRKFCEFINSVQVKVFICTQSSPIYKLDKLKGLFSTLGKKNCCTAQAIWNNGIPIWKPLDPRSWCVTSGLEGYKVVIKNNHFLTWLLQD